MEAFLDIIKKHSLDYHLFPVQILEGNYVYLFSED